MSERYTLPGVINEAVSAAMRNGIRTVIPAKIKKFDASKQRADCEILVKDVYQDEDDERQTQSWPIVTGVPVQFLGAGGFRITCPIKEGETTGSLFFSHRSLDKWLTGDGSEVDPEFDHDHSIADAVFIPGLMPFGAPWQSCPADEGTVGYDTGVQAHFSSSLIQLGDKSGNQFVALAQKVLDDLNQIKTDFDAHVHVGTSLVASLVNGSITGSTLVPTTPLTSPASVAASQVKAK